MFSTLAQQPWVQTLTQRAYHRMALPAVLLVLLCTADTRPLVVQVMSDAFWQVTTYVAATLMLFHGLSGLLDKQQRFGSWLQAHPRAQILFAAAMGALPGCGGAIVVVTQYVRGQLSFGGVVAVLTATMGDAAFLLLAAEPSTGLLLIAISMVVGVISGLAIDALHGRDWLRPALNPSLDPQDRPAQQRASSRSISLQGQFWKWALLPTVAIALLFSLQQDPNQWLGLAEGRIELIGALCLLAMLLLWACSREVNSYEMAVSEDPKLKQEHLLQKVALDTHFVTAWVVAAFLAFELTVHLTGWDLAVLFGNWLIMLPLMGVLIGLLPGCGPQILVTSMYISGAIPFSAQLGNAISNDGDALFPAIAMAPRAALMATLYSAIPALIVAYGVYAFFE